jgi:hypothetical protein
MPDVTVERRNAPRYPQVLAAEVVELPRGARLSARTSDVRRTGCYIDTLNPVPHGSQVRVRITHENEIFEAAGRIVYVSSGLGVGVAFTEVTPERQHRLDRWVEAERREFSRDFSPDLHLPTGSANVNLVMLRRCGVSAPKHLSGGIAQDVSAEIPRT